MQRLITSPWLMCMPLTIPVRVPMLLATIRPSKAEDAMVADATLDMLIC